MRDFFAVILLCKISSSFQMTVLLTAMKIVNGVIV